MTEGLFTNPSFIFDIICTIGLIVLMTRYAKKGAVGGMVQLIGNLLSVFGGRKFAQITAPVVFQIFFAGNIRGKIVETLAVDGSVDLADQAQRYAGFLPQDFRNSVVEAFQASLSNFLQDNAVVWAEQIVENMIKPLFLPVISIVLFFVAFALCRLTISLLVTVLGLLNNVPVVGKLNKFMGYGVGLLAGEADIFIALCAVWSLMIVTGGNLSWLNDAALSNSLFYQVFSQFNPFF